LTFVTKQVHKEYQVCFMLFFFFLKICIS